jgi:hypothetical protein
MPNTIRGERRVGDFVLASSGGIPRIEETYVFLVEAESKNTSRFEVARTPGLPVVGVTVSSYGLTRCASKACQRMEGKAVLWEVTCVFSSEISEGQNSQDPNSDPVAWVPIYETKFERVQTVVTKDFADAAIANSAGQEFPVGLTITRKLPIWEFFQFEPATVSDEEIIDRSETVNLNTFRGKAAQTLLCSVLSSSVGFYYGTRLRFTRYSLMYDRKNWKHKRLDVGTQYLAAGELKDYLSDDGSLMMGGLNGSGAKVAAGTDPAIVEFEMYDKKDFNLFLRV